MSEGMEIAKGKTALGPRLGMMNRHGLIAGATGTGKTVTLRVLAEELSRRGVPVFLSDVKGDISGLARAGSDNPKLAERVKATGQGAVRFEGFPVEYWDVFGELGHPLRCSISEMGPLLLSRLLGLNDIQSAVLGITFRMADDEGLLLLDLKDLRTALQYVSEHAQEIGAKYGNVSPTSVGAIQRALLTLEEQGGAQYFGEPAISLDEIIKTSHDGKGLITVLSAERLIRAPQLYATFLLWLLSELFETLPEVGDPERPRLVFFFDEAHLLFRDTPKILLERIEQVVRLIRSKGVGVYFVTQSPLDVPESVLGQLGNRIQHALRAFTPADQKTIKAVAKGFRQNPEVDVERTVTELAVGEALVSFLEPDGKPSVVERALIYAPASQFSPLAAEELKRMVAASPVDLRYRQAIDRESAYELLSKRAAAAPEAEEEAPAKKGPQSPFAMMLGSAARAIGSQIGRQIIRGILGSIGGGSSRSRSTGRRSW